MTSINQLINGKYSLKGVLFYMMRVHGKDYVESLELKSARRVYFCVVYNNNSGSYEENAKRLFNGEKFKGKGRRDVELVFGYGTLLGIKHQENRDGTKYDQYLIYNVVVLNGERKISVWETYHEAWIRLGNWVHKNKLHLGKECVVFT